MTRVSPQKNWMFFLDDYDASNLEYIKNVCEKLCDYYVIGNMSGSKIASLQTNGTWNPGTNTLFCVISFTDKARLTSKISIKRDDIECIQYSKLIPDGLSISKYKLNIQKMYDTILFSKNIIEDKKQKPVKVLDDDQLYEWQQNVINIIEKEPDERTVNWIWSNSGNVGKTSFQKYLVVKYGAAMLGGKAADCKNGIVDWKKNKGDTPEIILCNIPRSFSKEYISYQAFEEIKDMCFYSGKYEGGMIVGNCPHLFIFANCEPNVEKMSGDRWNIVNIDPPGYENPEETDVSFD